MRTDVFSFYHHLFLFRFLIISEPDACQSVVSILIIFCIIHCIISLVLLLARARVFYIIGVQMFVLQLVCINLHSVVQLRPLRL